MRLRPRPLALCCDDAHALEVESQSVYEKPFPGRHHLRPSAASRKKKWNSVGLGGARCEDSYPGRVGRAVSPGIGLTKVGDFQVGHMVCFVPKARISFVSSGDSRPEDAREPEAYTSEGGGVWIYF